MACCKSCTTAARVKDGWTATMGGDLKMAGGTDEKETIVRLRDVGTDNIFTEKERMEKQKAKVRTFVKYLTMANAGAPAPPPLTTHILDTAVGRPAGNVQMFLSRQNADGGFDQIEPGVTNTDGRGAFLKGGSWNPGVYKLYFDTDAYFKQTNTTGFYPYVEVVFRIVDASQHYHVPLLLSPFGYSTYRGS